MLIGNLSFIQKSIIKPGKPNIVDIMKKLPQPNDSTMNPDGEDKKVLAKPIKEESKAYCVAEYSFLHNTDRYATNAAEPKPPEKFSPATVIIKKENSGPTLFNNT